jgi:hypothetical protein
VLLERADGLVAAVADGESALTERGAHETVPPSEMVYDGDVGERAFGCPGKCRPWPMTRAVHADAYRCEACGGVWHEDDLLRRRGQHTVTRWARRSEVGRKLRRKLAMKKERT